MALGLMSGTVVLVIIIVVVVIIIIWKNNIYDQYFSDIPTAHWIKAEHSNKQRIWWLIRLLII